MSDTAKNMMDRICTMGMIDFIAAKRHAALPHILSYHAYHAHPTYHVPFLTGQPRLTFGVVPIH